MFSENGYKGTNLRELAAELNLSKSALYRHYESKEAIWEELINEVESYYNLHFGSENNLPKIPENAGELKELTLKLVGFTIQDEKIIMTRKILITEQFRNERVRDLATAHFNTGLEKMFTAVFSGMKENGALNDGEPNMLAFSYTSPISSLILLCDREPEKEKEILKKIEDFIDYFVKINKIAE